MGTLSNRKGSTSLHVNNKEIGAAKGFYSYLPQNWAHSESLGRCYFFLYVLVWQKEAQI